MQDKLDIETTTKQGPAPSSSAAPTGSPKSPAPSSVPIPDSGNLDIETTEARPRSPFSAASQSSPGHAESPRTSSASNGLTALSPGYVLDGKFAIGKVLGRGGIGIVYKATECDTDVEFALKVLSPELVADPDARADLKREVAKAQSLTHQNLLKVNYLAETPSLTYIVMECIDGENLEEYRVRNGGEVALGTFRGIAPQILAALEYLHGKGLVHCDVKPQNIMVTPSGEVKITDFGIARTIKEQLAHGATQQVPVGTLAYMSPEQIRGDAVCDRRTDIYSAGIMFHRLLTGVFPFAGDDRERIIEWHIDEKHVVRSTGHARLDDVIQKMLAVSPAQRYRTCGEVLVDLAQPWDVASADDSNTEAPPTLQVTDAWRQKYLKPYDDAVAALFANITVTPEAPQGTGKTAHIIPLFCGTQQAAVASVTSVSADTNKINLPLLNLECVECSIDHEGVAEHEDVPYSVRYTLRAWTLFVEDINQIVQQIKGVFNGGDGKIVYLTGRQPFRLVLGDISNNLDMDVPKGTPRVFKYEFELSLRAKVTADDSTPDKASARVPAKAVQLEEVLSDPRAFDCQLVSMSGVYASLYTSCGEFRLERGDIHMDISYKPLPKEQQQLVLRESEAKGHPIVVEGILDCSDDDPELTATSFAFVGPSAGARARQLDLEDLLAEPDSYDGAYVLIEGVYASLYTSDSSFKLSQGDHEIWVFYSRLPKEQKRKIMRESEADGRAVAVKGIVVCDGDEAKLSATRFAFTDEEAISESDDGAGALAGTQTTTSSKVPVAAINNVWVNYRTPALFNFGGAAKGVEIHISLRVDNMMGGAGHVGAYFAFSDGTPLKGLNSAYTAPDGQLCFGEGIVPPFDSSEWKDFVLFMPENELNLKAGIQHQCQVRVFVFRKNASGQWEQLTGSNPVPFAYPATL